MANEHNNIEQVFKNGFDNFEIDVSQKVWENIDNELFNTKIASSTKGKSWLEIFSISTTPLFILVISTLSISHKNTHEESIDKPIALVNKSEISDKNEKLDQLTINKVNEESETNLDVHEEEKSTHKIKTNITPLEEKQVTVAINDTQIPKKTQKGKIKEINDRKTPTLNENSYLNNDHYKNQESKIYARYSINKLKKGVLIVRLKTKQRSIDALLKRGMKKKAKKIENEIHEYNMDIMHAFEKNYNFSDVYFFYSDNTQKVKDMQFNSIFLNKDLVVDPSIKLNPLYDFYMIADFDQVRTLDENGKYSSQSLISEALVIKDRDFEQMSRPFPLFVKTGNKNQIVSQVIKLNDKFHKFHQNR